MRPSKFALNPIPDLMQLLTVLAVQHLYRTNSHVLIVAQLLGASELFVVFDMEVYMSLDTLDAVTDDIFHRVALM